MRTALYRYYDADGALLYVGISKSAAIRDRQHRDKSRWYESFKRMEVEWFNTRHEAAKAERRSIEKENPIHNIQYKPKPKMALGKAAKIILKKIGKENYRRLSKEEFDGLVKEHEKMIRRWDKYGKKLVKREGGVWETFVFGGGKHTPPNPPLVS